MSYDPSMVQRGMRRVAEERIRAAQQAGAFKDLPGSGRPLPDIDDPTDELWWVRKWVQREQLSQPKLNEELRQAKQHKAETRERTSGDSTRA